MDKLYDGAVSYERSKLYIGSIIAGFVAFIFIFCGIVSLANSFSKKNNPPADTPSASQSSSASWPVWSGLGIFFSLLSWGMYFTANDTSKTTENALAAHGVFNGFSTISGLFNRRQGGYFLKGE